MKRYYIILFKIFLIITGIHAQTIIPAPDRFPDTSRFADSARHWYRIFDEERVINPLENQQRHEDSQVSAIADNILLFQKNNGGWPKNYDMQAILTDAQIQAVLQSRQDNNTTFDNGATHSQLTYLAEAFTKTKDDRYKTAFIKGLNFVLQAQYDNGGWPQFYPDTSGYRKHITFNDNAMIGIMEMFQKIVEHDADYLFIDQTLTNRVHQAYQKGIDCILKCQIVENGKKTAWCQQHDHVNFAPQDARTFEKASICNQESSEIVKFLMNVHNPSEAVINAIESALAWFKESEIHGIRVKWIESTEEQFIYHKTRYDKIVVEDPEASPIWARFYELETHRPIFCGRDGIVHYTMAEIDRDRRTGYGWYNYAPAEIYTLYKNWKK